MTAIVMLPACRTSSEVANAAVQLTHVSQQLSDYYTDLSNQIDDTVALNEIQAEMLACRLTTPTVTSRTLPSWSSASVPPWRRR
jgi:hypothetical protein